MDSIWLRETAPSAFAPLRENIQTDVLIIGGGMAGLLCSYFLKKAGVSCVLLEAKQICGGITKNTTAKLTLQHGLLYRKLTDRFGQETAQLYLQAQQRALSQYAKLCKTIPCDYERKDSYVYSLSDRRKLENEVAALQRLGCDAELCNEVALPFCVAGAVKVRNQAQFHPLKFAYALAKELDIYENSKVVELMPKGALTEYARIRCEKMIIATHFPILNKHGAYPLKLYQHRSYVLALQGADIPDGMYVDENSKGLSFRSYQNLLLLGGGSHRTGKQGGNWQELTDFARAHYPSAKIVSQWATQDCMSLDGVPYIGQYSKSTPDVYVATGFCKWGMTSSMVAGAVLSDLVQGRSNPFCSVFSPSRTMLRPQLLTNTVSSLIGLLTPTAPRCPHLGCALKYNPAEHSWDCPCHGSRFSASGELIDNPATDDKRL